MKAILYESYYIGKCITIWHASIYPRVYCNQNAEFHQLATIQSEPAAFHQLCFLLLRLSNVPRPEDKKILHTNRCGGKGILNINLTHLFKQKLTNIQTTIRFCHLSR